MLFKPEHFSTLKQCIADSNPNLKERKRISELNNETEVRFLWDIFWDSKWSSKHMEQYREGDYKDVNLHTAIRKAVKQILHEQEVHEEGNVA